MKRIYFFILLIILIILLGDYSLVRLEKEASTAENRYLQKFEHFTLNSYFNGEYQNMLENALADQFVKSESIKSKFNLTPKFYKASNIPKSICKNKYVHLSNSYYSFDCSDSIFFKYLNEDKKDQEQILKRIKFYNQLNDYIDTYYYYIQTPNVFNFEKNKYSIDVLNILKENLKGNYKLDALTFKHYDEYIDYFYKNDHHWNYKGSYEAYKDIISMIRPNDKYLKPVEKVTFNNLYFYGSAARVSQNYDFKEEFTVYKFNYPNMETLINRKYSKYGQEEKYFNNENRTDIYANHYGIFYGGDEAEIIFNTNNNKYNLLILGTSYTNAINKLIASHFKKTYIIDLRYYENIFGEKFDMKKYIEENNIDKVLIITEYDFLKAKDCEIMWGGKNAIQ